MTTSEPLHLGVKGKQASGLRALPRGAGALGFISMFMDLSSEMIHALLPVYLVSVMDASALTVGLIEGTHVFPQPKYPNTRRFSSAAGRTHA